MLSIGVIMPLVALQMGQTISACHWWLPKRPPTRHLLRLRTSSSAPHFRQCVSGGVPSDFFLSYFRYSFCQEEYRSMSIATAIMFSVAVTPVKSSGEPPSLRCLSVSYTALTEAINGR
jgi:hypothetical protein